MENIDVKKQLGRIIAGGFYDLQEVRISSANRIRDIVRKKVEGIAFDVVEEKKDSKVKKIEYTDSVLLDKLLLLKKSGDLSDSEFKYISNVFDLLSKTESVEGVYKRRMLEYVKSEPLYINFLEKVRGIGAVLSANLIKEFGYCDRYDTVSKLWAHTGNGVDGGVAPKKRKGEDLRFSPRLRTLTWKVSDCLLKCNKGFYREVYDSEKAKQLSRVYNPGVLFRMFGSPYKKDDVNLSLLHAHNRALRKMRKLFLSHYWSVARELSGQDSRELYVVDKLGHKNIVTWKKVLSFESSSCDVLSVDN